MAMVGSQRHSSSVLCKRYRVACDFVIGKGYLKLITTTPASTIYSRHRSMDFTTWWRILFTVQSWKTLFYPHTWLGLAKSIPLDHESLDEQIPSTLRRNDPDYFLCTASRHNHHEHSAIATAQTFTDVLLFSRSGAA